MSEYIVISREEMTKLLIEFHRLGRASALQGRTANNLHSNTSGYVHTLPTGWRPIAEAPKDGTWVLVAHKDERGLWRMESCQFEGEFWVNNATVPYDCMESAPTHFLPLIEPTEK